MARGGPSYASSAIVWRETGPDVITLPDLGTDRVLWVRIARVGLPYLYVVCFYLPVSSATDKEDLRRHEELDKISGIFW